MAKKENLTRVEEEMFKFLRSSFAMSRHSLKAEFGRFLEKIKHHERDRFETRAFAYLDLVSWVESKVYMKPMSEIIREKYLNSKKRHYVGEETVTQAETVK